MTACEAYAYAAQAAENAYPSARRAIRTMSHLLCHACGAGGDMMPHLAEELLDDIFTDGHRIDSDKIKAFGEDLFFLTQRHGLNIPYNKLQSLCGL